MPRSVRSIAMLLLVASCALAVPSAVFAQSTTAVISGAVKDETGAVLPGVAVSVRNIETGVIRAAVTDSRGAYRIPSLPPGKYEITAQLSGFKTEVHSGIQLAIGQEVTLPFALTVGQLEEQVLVTGAAPLVNIESAAVGYVVDTKQIRDLPLNGRSFEQLAILQPGVIAATTASQNNIQGQGRKISIAGARPTQVSFLLDGTDINDAANNTPGSASGNMLGVDTVREFQVQVSTYSAEFGRSAGGTISAVTRSGTNEFHGSVFEFHRNSALDARNFFDAKANPAAFTRNQFGLTIGGPLRRNRTFLFAGYEGLRERLSLSGVSRVPTAAARQGVLPGQAPVAVSPFVQRVLAMFPLPNGQEIGGGVATYLSSPKKPTDEHFVMARIDHRFSDRDSFAARFNFDDADSVTPDSLEAFQARFASRTEYAMVEETHIFSSALLNTLRFSMNRSKMGIVQEALIDDIPFLVPQRPGGEIAFGPISVQGLSPLGTGSTSPNVVDQRLWEINNTLDFSRSAHTIKAGANYKFYDIDYRGEFTAGGRYVFNNLASFLRGNASRLEVQLPDIDSQRLIRQSMVGLFVQDKYKATDRLTVNLGLRYEFVTSPTERDGKVANLRDVERDAKPTIGDPFFKNPSLRNFAPRGGFAWDLTGDGKTSVSGGAGLFHDELLPFAYRVPMTRVPPFWQQVFVTQPAFPLDLASANLNLSDYSQMRLDTFTYEPDQPRRYQYSLTVQREIGRDLAVQVGYIGARGLNLLTVTEANTARPQTDADGNHFFLVDASGRPLQPVRNPNFANIRTRETDSDSYYNAGHLQLHKRYNQGFQFQISYTFGKSTDTSAAGVGSTDFGNDAGQLMDPDCTRCDLGPSPYDVRHAFVANFSVDIPSPSGAAPAVRAIFGGWQLSGIFTARSGNPFTVWLGFDRAGQLTRSGGDAQRPNLRPGASANPRIGEVDRWFDIGAFELPPRGRFGNLGRNTLIGPGLQNFDLVLAKNVPLGSDRNLQFRFEAFNLFNRANFDIPAARVIFSGFQVINGQDVPIVNPAAGRIEGTTTTARQIQIGVKVIF